MNHDCAKECATAVREARREAFAEAAAVCDERARQNFAVAEREDASVALNALRQFAGEEALGCAADLRALVKSGRGG